MPPANVRESKVIADVLVDLPKVNEVGVPPNVMSVKSTADAKLAESESETKLIAPLEFNVAVFKLMMSAI